MPKRELIFHVEVIEIDEKGASESICSHKEYYSDPGSFRLKWELCQLAYEAFDQARNKFYDTDRSFG